MSDEKIAKLKERLHPWLLPFCLTDRQTDELVRAAFDEVTALFSSPPVAQQGWRPIESAPKAYSPPLSIYNHHAPEILGLWGEAFYCICSWGGPSMPYWIGSDNKKIPFQPTRWMPLP